MWNVLIRTAILYIFLNIIMRFMGKRQIGELEVSDMITTLLLSELVAIPISDVNLPILNGIVPILFIFACELFLSSFKNRSQKLKTVLEGRPRYIIYKGRLLQGALKKSRISLNEFLSALRTNGIFSIATVEYAVLEANGSVTTLLKSEDSPPTVAELDEKRPSGKKRTGHAPMAHALIIDGEVMEKSLSLLGLNREWLEQQLQKEKLEVCEVFLFSYSENGERLVIEKEEE